MQTAFVPNQSRFPLLDTATVTDATVRTVFGEIERELGFGIVPNMFRALANQPTVLRATWDLFRATVLQGRLPRIVKEMVGIVVSKANNSDYALQVHLHSLGVQGVAESVLAALAAGSAAPQGLAPSVAAIIQFAYKAAYQGPLAIGRGGSGTTQSHGHHIRGDRRDFRGHRPLSLCQRLHRSGAGAG